MIDLESLPDPEVIEELSFEAVFQSLLTAAIAQFAAAGIDYDVGDLETDPVAMVLQAAAYRETLLRARANHVARNQILAYSGNSDLDHLASHYDVARQAGETDDRLRTRIQLATIGRSPGGTHERLKAVALACDLAVRDIATWTQGRDPTVNIAVLSTDIGGEASVQLLATVRAAVEEPSVRVVSDRYTVVSAVQSIVDLNLSVALAPDSPETLLDELPDLIRARRDQEDLLGLDLFRSWISKTAMVAGVSDVVVNEPAENVSADPHEAIKIGEVTIEFTGRVR